jgi:1,4-dihydroxy-2-naphthoate octaprenyltransferase
MEAIMRYLCILIAVALVALGAIVGSFVPLGSGSAVVIGGFLGIVLGGFYVDAARRRNWQPLLRSSANDKQSSEINQKALEQGLLNAQQAHINDDTALNNLRNRV